MGGHLTFILFFFFNDPPPPEIYPLPLRDALPISGRVCTDPETNLTSWQSGDTPAGRSAGAMSVTSPPKSSIATSVEPVTAIGYKLRSNEKRSEEHTSELQSQSNIVCRLLLEKKKT